MRATVIFMFIQKVDSKALMAGSSAWAALQFCMLKREHVGQQAAQPELLPHQHEELEGSSG